MARELRKANYMEQQSVARHVGISAAYLSRIESGQKGASRGVNLDIIERLAATYGVPTSVLIQGNDKSAGMAATA